MKITIITAGQFVKGFKPMICPKCGEIFNDYPAVSRVDNKTKICSSCGIAEALESFFNRKGVNKSNVNSRKKKKK